MILALPEGPGLWALCCMRVGFFCGVNSEQHCGPPVEPQYCHFLFGFVSQQNLSVGGASAAAAKVEWAL